MFLDRLRALLQLVQIDLNERGSSGSYDPGNYCARIDLNSLIFRVFFGECFLNFAILRKG